MKPKFGEAVAQTADRPTEEQRRAGTGRQRLWGHLRVLFCLLVLFASARPTAGCSPHTRGRSAQNKSTPASSNTELALLAAKLASAERCSSLATSLRSCSLYVSKVYRSSDTTRCLFSRAVKTSATSCLRVLPSLSGDITESDTPGPMFVTNLCLQNISEGRMPLNILILCKAISDRIFLSRDRSITVLKAPGYWLRTFFK